MSSRRKRPATRKSARKVSRPARPATRSKPRAAAKSARKSAPHRAAKPATKAKARVKARVRTKPKAPQLAPAPATQASGQVHLDQPVADFTAAATGGGKWRLQDARGRKLVLYFYPRDNTPGCTLEGQQFAALAPQFAEAGVTVLGVSRDSLASHEKFRDQMRFPFDLLSDTGETICRQFSVIREKTMYGRKVLGIERSTFLIDAAGVLRREWRGVKVDGHAQAVLMAAQTL